MGIPVSMLDLTPIEPGLTPHQALQRSVDLAILADRLGYQRVWYAEHHNAAGLASATPEIMIEHVASRTAHIRVGSGGVMLPNHSPLKIVETFRLLEALHPGRIDLGLGRAPGTDTTTAYAMRRSREAMTAADYPEQLAELIAFDDEAFPPDHAFHAIRAVPLDVKMPPLWLLGSSDFSAQLAAQTGLGFAFAAHINRAAAVPALRSYRENFVPSARFPEPWAILTISASVGEESRPLNYFQGDVADIYAKIVDLVVQSGADEVMINPMLPSIENRRRTITQLAAEFGLTERPQITPFPEPATLTS